jgi:penicillin-binding protein 2
MNRIRIFSLVLILMFISLLLGIFNLAVIKGEKYKELSNKNCIRLLPQPGARGKIFDRQGSVIVDNRLSYDVLILSRNSSQVYKALDQVARILHKDPESLKETFKKSYLSSSVPTPIAKNIELKQAIALEELKGEIPGITIQPNPVRRYPNGKLACHAIGYLNEIDRWRLTNLEDYGYKTKDIVGFGGLEEKYDYYLRQEEGGLSVEVDHRGRFTRVLGFKPPYNGRDIRTTMDLRIQKIVEDKLSGKKGAVVIMDPYTGEIIAMASFPDFDPSIFVERSSSEITNLFSSPQGPLINRAISSTYPPGSVFKVVVASAGLETGKINRQTTFLCTGVTTIGRMEFNCWNVHGRENLDQAIAHSCNSYFYRTGLLVGAQNIYEYALKFGLSRPTGFELPYEASGLIPSPLWKKVRKFKGWFDGDTVNMSIGQGDVLVSPIQIVRMVAVFANRGYLVTPYLVTAVDNQDISLQKKKMVSKIALRDSTIEEVREGMRQVVLDPEGTGNVLSSLSVPVAGKTGSAQAPPGLAHGWFAGFFPYKNPKYAICVFLEHAGAGYASCVVTKQIIDEMIREGLL